MRRIDVGILRAAEIKFDLIGDFCSDAPFVASGNVVSMVDGKLCLNGVPYDVLHFYP